MRHLGKEGELALRGLLQFLRHFYQLVALRLKFTLLAVKLLVAAYGHIIRAYAHGHHDPNQHYNGYAGKEQHLLHGVARQKFVHLRAKLVNALLALVHLVALYAEQACRGGIDYSRVQPCVALERLVPQYAHGRLYYLVAACGIDECGCEHTLLHIVKSATLGRQTVNANHLHLGVAGCHQSLVHLHASAIVRGCNDLWHNAGRNQTVTLLWHTCSLPPHFNTGQHLYARRLCQHVGQSGMTLACCRASHVGSQLYHSAMPLEFLHHTSGHVLAYAAVVGPDKSRIFVGECFTVNHYHRYATAHHTLHHGGERARLVGGHHQQVDALVYQTVYLFYLLCIVIVSRTYIEFYIFVVKHCFTLHFAVHLLTPRILAALRHTYFERVGLMALACCHKQHKRHKHKVEYMPLHKGENCVHRCKQTFDEP